MVGKLLEEGDIGERGMMEGDREGRGQEEIGQLNNILSTLLIANTFFVTI